MELAEAANIIVDVSHRCYQRGWSPATSSNYSLRMSPAAIAITCSGLDKGQLTVDGVMSVDAQGQALSAGKPSAETLLHTQLYNAYSACAAVLHTHSPNACVLSRLLDADEICLEGYEIVKAFDGFQSHEQDLRVPIFENTQDIAALSLSVDEYCAQRELQAYIIRGHGIYVWAVDMPSCWRQLEALEYMLDCELRMYRARMGQV